ncbi:MAG TPA: PIN domain nuclease, partial [Anaerolineales bacterium]|nr:PIN domain nuclease [Anaerolineales bacterium]
MLLVDTSVWVDYFNGIENPQTDYLHENLDRTPILVGDLILAEILQGFRSESDFEKVRRVLGKFIQADMVGTELAVQSARNFRFLRQKGIPVRKTIGSLIATFCT